MNNIVAILSTTVLPLDGTYQVFTLSKDVDISIIKDVPHYIGHPDTKAIIQDLGAVAAPTKLFAGLKVGQSALCFPIMQGKSLRKDDGFSSAHQSVSLADLDIRIITRLA